MFLFPEIDGSFRLGCSCLSKPCVSETILVSCSFFFFWRISSIFKPRKSTFLYYCPNLVRESLACCLKTCAFLPDLSIILFLYALSAELLLKEQCSASWLSSLVHVLRLRLWFVRFLGSSFVYQKKEQLTFAGWRFCLPCWLSGEHLPFMTPKPVAWVPCWVIFIFDIFLMGVILWLYQIEGLFKICATDSDVT